MKQFKLLSVTLAIGLVSCVVQEPSEYVPGYLKPNPDEPITAYFSNVSLMFNLSSSNTDEDRTPDFYEICSMHAVDPKTTTQDPNEASPKLRGEITSLYQIVWNADKFEENRKPSIMIKLSSLFQNDTTKVFSKGEVSTNALQCIPNLQKYQSHILTIKSIVTEANGLQIVWEQHSTGGFGKWINLSVHGNTIYFDDLDYDSVSVIVKSGVNNSKGDIAVRPSGANGYSYDVLLNTMDGVTIKQFPDDEDTELSMEDYCVVETPCFSPTILRPVYSGGQFQSNIRWKTPIVLQRVNKR